MIKVTLGKYKKYFDQEGKVQESGSVYLFSKIRTINIIQRLPNSGSEVELVLSLESGERVLANFPASSIIIERMTKEIYSLVKKDQFIDFDDLVDFNLIEKIKLNPLAIRND